jgi:hypothetical protein
VCTLLQTWYQFVGYKGSCARLLFFSELSLIVVLATDIITTVVLFGTGLLAQLGSQAPSRQQLLDIETRLRSLQSKVSALCLTQAIFNSYRFGVCTQLFAYTFHRWQSC